MAGRGDLEDAEREGDGDEVVLEAREADLQLPVPVVGPPPRARRRTGDAWLSRTPLHLVRGKCKGRVAVRNTV